MNYIIATLRKAVAALLFLALAPSAGYSQSWVVLYYPSWMQNTYNSSQCPPESINLAGITHISHFFSWDNIDLVNAPYLSFVTKAADSAEIQWGATSNGGGKGIDFQNHLITYAHSKGVKVLLCIKQVGTCGLNFLAQDSTRAAIFAASLNAYLLRKGYDGVDFDWEGFACGGTGTPAQKAMLTRVVRRALAPGMLLVYDLPSGDVQAPDEFSPANDNLVDRYMLQSYGYDNQVWGGSSNVTWFYAPLYRAAVGHPVLPGIYPSSNIDAWMSVYSPSVGRPTTGVLAWAAAGHSKSKIVLLMSASGDYHAGNTGILQPEATSYLPEPKYQEYLAYGREAGSVVFWDSLAHAEYTYNTDSVYYVTCETPRSIADKMQWVDSVGAGGVGMYSAWDDFDYRQTFASRLRNPLVKAMVDGVLHLQSPLGTFQASPLTLPAGGGSVTLSWSSTNATSAAINQGIGTVALSGTRVVSVTSTTTFRLTLTNDNGSTNYDVTVTVLPPAPTGSFSANPSSLPSGGGQSTLSWTSTNASSASIDQGIGAVAVSGTRVVSVVATQKFRLTLSNGGGSASYDVTVTVAAPAGSPTGSFTANPSTLPPGGGQVTLSWTSTNATGATIDQGIGTVALSGSRVVTITDTTTFTLSLTNTAGTRTYAVTVSVPPLPPPPTPKDFVLEQNYPNPFNPGTKIVFQLPSDALVQMTVCNVLGQEVRTLVDASLPSGTHTVEFTAENLPAGIYFYTLKAGAYVETRKMVLIR